MLSQKSAQEEEFEGYYNLFCWKVQRNDYRKTSVHKSARLPEICSAIMPSFVVET